MADLKEKPDSEDLKLNMTAKGNTGTFIQNRIIQSDYIEALNGVDGQVVFKKMTLSDSQIRKLMHAVNNPIKSATWTVPPISEEQIDIEAAALVSEVLFEGMDTDWLSKLDEILTFPWYGHAVFEVVFDNKYTASLGLHTGIKAIGYRNSETLVEWGFDKNGVLKSIKQKVMGDLEIETEMPASSLIIFYNEKLGSNNGYPFCRMLYGNYHRKKVYKELQAIGIERSSLNTPIVTVPDTMTSDSPQYQKVEQYLREYTMAENAFFIIPESMKLDFQTSTYNPQNTQTAIKAENEEIAGSLVGMFLEMGLGGNSGNQAGTEVSADFFAKGIQYLANKICGTINRDLIPKLVRANFGDKVEVMPKLTVSGISEESGKTLMEIVTGYVDSGVLTMDEVLEDHIRNAHNLPKKMEGSVLDNQETKTKKTIQQDKPTNPSTVEMNDKSTGLSVGKLIDESAIKINEVIIDSARFVGEKYINDVMNRYKQLGKDKKLSALNKVTVGGHAKFRKALLAELENTFMKSVEQVKAEMGLGEITLNEDGIEINLNEEIPTYANILLKNQAQLISTDTVDKMIANIGFAFNSIAVSSDSESIIKQSMTESLDNYLSKVEIKGDDVSSFVVNNGRKAVFESDDVFDQIHSYTFMNPNPKTEICQYCTGKTFAVTDAESMLLAPPLHHRCKSFLRANLKTSRGVEKLEIVKLKPSASASKGITLNEKL